MIYKICLKSNFTKKGTAVFRFFFKEEVFSYFPNQKMHEILAALTRQYQVMVLHEPRLVKGNNIVPQLKE